MAQPPLLHADHRWLEALGTERYTVCSQRIVRVKAGRGMPAVRLAAGTASVYAETEGAPSGWRWRPQAPAEWLRCRCQ